MRVLKSDECLARDIDALVGIEPQFNKAYQATGPIELRQRKDGYASLVRTIIGQQVSVASAEAIWTRLQTANLHQLENISNASHDELRACGLSKQKASYLSALADADIDFESLEQKSDADIVTLLTSVKGIGSWTAEIYLMFCLGRADVISAGDLALQESARILFELPERPDAKAFAEMAQNWSPYRNAAAQLLWAYYHVMKNREGIGV